MAGRIGVRHLAVAAAAGGVLLVGVAQPASAATGSPAAAPAAAPATAPAQSLGRPSVPYETWLKDVQAVADSAGEYLQARVPQAPTTYRPAIVLDIDNTSLETDYTPSYPTPAIAAVLEVVRAAHDRGVKVFFVTARPDFIDAFTRYNLTKVGYPVDGLYGRSLWDLFQETGAFKTAKRQEIERNGYTIVANIGNNTTDLVGGHAERTFKLPDYGGTLS
ncbi:HAD family acid phosphatase [Kitasatospora sp. NPDC085895]|uniref:HAD family acid phosphatase n=1 Tax=Kitasatospora sp. NPDC085895 TaxID=3155057 RepID=UPI00344CD100